MKTGHAVYNPDVIRLSYPTQNLRDVGKVRGLIRENLAGLDAVIRWNARYDVRLFRMGQS